MSTNMLIILFSYLNNEQQFDNNNNYQKRDNSVDR